MKRQRGFQMNNHLSLMGALKSILTLLFLLTFLVGSSSAEDEAKSYIVYMGNHMLGSNPGDILASHQHMLGLALNGVEHVPNSFLYSYKNAFNGFAAKLTALQVDFISRFPEVISLFPNRANKLHTTRTWKFLGVESSSDPLQGSLWDDADFGSDVIIGMLDSGIWPESASFDDTGYGPVPGRWKGSCEAADQFGPQNCNRKLIGGKHFIKGLESELGPFNVTKTPDFISPRDHAGHGTHTSATAAGSFVPDARLFGFASGVAKGGAPKARIAMYKVCWSVPTNVSAGGDTCFDADLLAAFDEGIADGVDIFSVSIGGVLPIPPFFKDSIAIGSFHAVSRGIPVICSAGNAGPAPGSVINVAPWLFTIAASTLDRSFPSDVVLGNDQRYHGLSLSEDKLLKSQYPVVLSSHVGAPGVAPNASLLCLQGSLDPALVTGKIVACQRGVNPRLEKGSVVKAAGGIAMILGNDIASGDDLAADAHVLPATHIGASDARALFDYINATISPTAFVTPATTVVDVKPAPTMASFSSQGPNSLIPDLLKPDITAPGTNILAAWTNASGVIAGDPRRVLFNVISGTSMSCPHITGIFALLKSIHPRWSPAAIKSAIMTTASVVNNELNGIENGSHAPAGPYNYGAGHVQPVAAADPGLVYDTSIDDYIKFLCGLYSNSSLVSTITGQNLSCPADTITARDLNYPSVSVTNLLGTVTVPRTVMNVAKKHGTYNVSIQPPTGVDVTISPAQLIFSNKYESQSFNICLTAVGPVAGTAVFGSFTWKSSTHQVRSPIVVTFP